MIIDPSFCKSHCRGLTAFPASTADTTCCTVIFRLRIHLHLRCTRRQEKECRALSLPRMRIEPSRGLIVITPNHVPYRRSVLRLEKLRDTPPLLRHSPYLQKTFN